MTKDQIEDIYYNLKETARHNCDIAIAKAEAYRDGYIKAGNDFREMVKDILKEEVINS